MEKLLFTALLVCGVMSRLAWEGSTAGGNQYHHIWDDHHNMDISTTDIIYHTPPTQKLWRLRTHSYFLSLMSAHEADDVTTAFESYLQCIYLLFFFTRNIPQQKQRHRLRGKLEAYHDITVHFFFFFNFWAVLFSYFQVTESSNNNIFLKVKGLTMQSEIPPVFEQCTRASTNFWQKLFQVTAFLIPKSTCLMKMFILK